MKIVDVVDGLFDRAEQEGVAVSSVDDGFVFVLTVEILKRLLADAESSPTQKVVAFVRNEIKGLA